MNFREELVQIAAVCVAIIEDLDEGEALVGVQTSGILLEILDERFAQDEKWGPQHHDPLAWLMILMEEVGEAAEHWLGEEEIINHMIAVGRQASAWLEREGLA